MNWMLEDNLVSIPYQKLYHYIRYILGLSCKVPLDCISELDDVEKVLRETLVLYKMNGWTKETVMALREKWHFTGQVPKEVWDLPHYMGLTEEQKEFYRGKSQAPPTSLFGIGIGGWGSAAMSIPQRQYILSKIRYTR